MTRPAKMALVVTILCGCGSADDAPVQTARAFAQAVQREDMATVVGLLERRAVEHLEHAAEQAGDQIGGRRTIEPREMLQVVDLDWTFQVAHAERLDDAEDVTQVRLVGADQSVHIVELVFEDGAWRVRIPLPDTR
jgi:hypothetical protein